MKKMEKAAVVSLYVIVSIVIIIAISATVGYLLGFWNFTAPYATKISHIISFVGGFVAAELIRDKFEGEH